MAVRRQVLMNCERVRLEISNYLDGDISPALGEAISEHLHDCCCCAALYNSTRNILDLFRNEVVLQVPMGYAERLHEFLLSK